MSTKISTAAVARCHLEVRDAPDRRDIFERAIKLAWARGLYPEMVALSKRVLRHDASRSDARYYYAVGLRKLGQCDAALPHYEAYTKLRGDDPDPYFGMGLCHEALGDKNAAEAAFRAYLSREKREDRTAWRKKALGHMARLSGVLPIVGRSPVAPKVKPLVKPLAPRPAPPVAKVKPTPPTPPAPPASCDQHAKAFASDPFATKAYDAFAECALKRKEHAKVVKTMKMAIRDNPDFARGWFQLGRAYQAQGKAQQARRALARACKAGVNQACAP
ncbi:MAG: tetratricopeptide repeat protein [Deltaproteobacteria bacterium]|nr:tetratricopeptide repeat protein [Deltaproteobacteria bacterium]